MTGVATLAVLKTSVAIIKRAATQFLVGFDLFFVQIEGGRPFFEHHYFHSHVITLKDFKLMQALAKF